MRQLMSDLSARLYRLEEALAEGNKTTARTHYHVAHNLLRAAIRRAADGTCDEANKVLRAALRFEAAEQKLEG